MVEALRLVVPAGNVDETELLGLAADAALDLVRSARQMQPDSQELFRVEQDICRATPAPQN